MSDITFLNDLGYTITLTPGVVLTLQMNPLNVTASNTCSISVPALETGIAVRRGGLGTTIDPVNPTPNVNPALAGAPASSELTGPAIWAFTTRSPEWKFLLDVAEPGPITIRLAFVLEQDNAPPATPPQQARSPF